MPEPYRKLISETKHRLYRSPVHYTPVCVSCAHDNIVHDEVYESEKEYTHDVFYYWDGTQFFISIYLSSYQTVAHVDDAAVSVYVSYPAYASADGHILS
jgi:hypothetical protein